MPTDNMVLVTDELLEQERKLGNWHYLLFAKPELLYPSLHPITNMKMFDTGKYYTNESEIPDNRIRVTRYSQSVTGGKYNPTRSRDSCGWFLYAEPGSTTFLSYKTSYMSFNKVTAAMELRKAVSDKMIKHNLKSALYKMAGDDILKPHLLRADGIYPRDLMFTPQDAVDIYDGEIEDYELCVTHNSRSHSDYQSDVKAYLGMDIVGPVEILDNPLCKATEFLGYDILIFENSIGEIRVETEILDTRGLDNL